MKISFVIPCYRSENTLETVVNEIKNKMASMQQHEYEIILINDCSPDATFAVIQKLCGENHNIIGLDNVSYFAAKRFVIDEILKYQNAYPYVIGLVLRTTKNICNVKVEHRDRLAGVSGYSFKKLIALWVNGFTSFSVMPLRVASYGGVFVAIMGFLYAIYIIISKIANPDRIIGWSSTIAIMLVLGGFVLIVLGMIGEYIGRIYICLNNAPQYVLRSIVNYDKAEINK